MEEGKKTEVTASRLFNDTYQEWHEVNDGKRRKVSGEDTFNVIGYRTIIVNSIK